jgi:LPS-assembly protein
MSKNVSTFSMNVSLLRDENFQDVLQSDDKVILRKLPSLEFNSRDHQLFDGPVPLWFSLDSSFGLVSRTQRSFQSRRFVQRGDVSPKLTSTFRVAEFQFTPSFGIRHTSYGQRRDQGSLQGLNLYRNSREFSLDIAAPSFQRIYKGPKWLGDRVKHVIEPRIRYRFVDGIDNFDKVIRFDERDLLTNTNEADFSIMNRLYAKDATTGAVREVASLEVWQRRYFDPHFGGALVPGARNVFSSTVDVTPFAFLDQARNASPIVTSFRIRPNWRTFLGWRTDYDPLRRKIVNTSVDSGWRINDLWSVELGHHAVRTPVALSPPSNQLSTLLRLGDFNRRGWNVAWRTNYDYRQSLFIYNATQATYNTDCCGFSFEWRRFAIGPTRDENQFRVALSIANVGSFGTLSPRERMF